MELRGRLTDNFIYFKFVLRWELAERLSGFPFGPARVPRYHYLGVTMLISTDFTPKSPFTELRAGIKPRTCTPPLAHNAHSKKTS